MEGAMHASRVQREIRRTPAGWAGLGRVGSDAGPGLGWGGVV